MAHFDIDMINDRVPLKHKGKEEEGQKSCVNNGWRNKNSEEIEEKERNGQEQIMTEDKTLFEWEGYRIIHNS